MARDWFLSWRWKLWIIMYTWSGGLKPYRSSGYGFFCPGFGCTSFPCPYPSPMTNHQQEIAREFCAPHLNRTIHLPQQVSPSPVTIRVINTQCHKAKPLFALWKDRGRMTSLGVHGCVNYKGFK